MATIGVVTDSTAYLPHWFKERYQVEVVSLAVNFEGDSFPESEMDDDFKGFYERLRRAPRLPSTSQPSVGEFLDVYKRVGARSDGIVSIHITEGLSGTVGAARTAAQMLPELGITVVDSRSTSVGLYMAVDAAARAIDAGMSMDEVLTVVHYVVENSQVFFTIDTLEYLRRGGRIGAAAALLGNLLQIKPILYFNARKNNIIDVYGKVRTRGGAMRRILDEVRKSGPDVKICAACAGDQAVGQELLSVIRMSYPHMAPELCAMGPVVGVHGGPGTVGLCFYPLAPDVHELLGA